METITIEMMSSTAMRVTFNQGPVITVRKWDYSAGQADIRQRHSDQAWHDFSSAIMFAAWSSPPKHRLPAPWSGHSRLSLTPEDYSPRHKVESLNINEGGK